MQIKYKIFNEKSYDLLVIYKIGILENSIHFIFDKNTKECVIIDPAWESELFLNIISQYKSKLTQIWLTHWHHDHTNAVDELVEKTGAKVFIGKDECLLNIDSQVSYLTDKDIINIGNTTAQVLFTPGHTNGGVSYLLNNRFIAGDTLFIYGAGHCQLPMANAGDFYNTMQRIKKKIPNNFYLHCGHDYGSKITTTMYEQKIGNPFLLIDNKDDFILYRELIHDKTRNFPMNFMSKDELFKVLTQ